MRTDHLDGGTLADRLRSGPLNRDELEQLAADLLGMLASLHAKGTLHRDLSPATVRLDRSARLHSSKIGAQRGGASGVAADVSADLYACGTVLAAAAGPDASAPVLVLIGMLTAAEPDLRPASAAEALNLLGVTGSTASPPPVPPGPPVPRARPVAEVGPVAKDGPADVVPFPPAASFPPLVDSRPVADTPPLVEPLVETLVEPQAETLVQPLPAYPAGPPRSRRPSRRVVLAGIAALVAVLAVVAGVLALGGGDDAAGTEIPPPADTSLQQQLDDLDSVIDTLGE